MARFSRWSALGAVVGLGMLGCGGGESGGGGTGPTVRTPTAIALVSGANQTGPAGGALATPIVVRVSDSRGPLPGVAVQFTSTSGGGSAQPPSVFTDPNGLASATWFLGTEAGVANALRISATGLTDGITITGTAVAGPAAIITPFAGFGLVSVVNRPVADRPVARVTDQFGNPVSGELVTFTVTGGGGTITGPTVLTNGVGQAQVGSWILGPVAGPNTLRAAIGNGSVADFSATGGAATLQFTNGGGQSANAGTAVPLVPVAVARDADGHPLANVPVTFTAAVGGGQVVGSVVLTDGTGSARPSSWILGLTPGPNELRATSPGATTASVTATGLQATATTVVVETTGPLAGFHGNFLTARPTVRVQDNVGAPVAGVAVLFSIESGGGTLFGPAAISDANGRASAMAWRLGTGAAQALRITATGLAPVLLQATATAPPPPGDYRIDIRYVGLQPTAGQRAAFDAAAERWQRAIVGDLPDEAAQDLPAVGTLCDALNEPIDDLLIFVRLQEIDGVGNILGSAGPCWLRDVSGLTVVGGMRLDVADLNNLENTGQLTSVILHEMGHVLGIGTLWNSRGLIVGRGSPDPYFTGPAARTVFETIFSGGAGYAGLRVPVENVGGAGSRDGHWRESVLRTELMTSILNSGTNALSALSLVSMRDMGYLINDAIGEPFEILPAFMAAPAVEGPSVLLPPVAPEVPRLMPRRRR